MTESSPTTRTATVTVGGHSYRVHSSATEEELARLAALVDERLLALPLNQRGDPKSLVLVALGLAHDLEQERQLRAAERRVLDGRVRTLVARVDDALGHVDANGEPLPALPAPPPAAAEAATDSTTGSTTEVTTVEAATPSSQAPAVARTTPNKPHKRTTPFT